MILTELELNNFGKHKHLRFDCNAPIVGLVGPNGSGKSTVLTAFKFLITGELEDNQETYVRNGEGNATVSGRFIKNGKPGAIFRQIGKSSKRKLEWDGKVVTLAKEFDEVMARIFDADKKAISSAVFISQGKLAGMLFNGDADRMDLFIRLVNLAFCAERARWVDAQISKLKADMVDLRPALDAASVEREAALRAWDDAKAVVATQPDCAADIALCQDIRKNQAELARLEKELASLEVDLKKNEAEQQALLAIYPGSTLPTLKAIRQTIGNQLARARADYQTWTGWQTSCLEYRRLTREVGELETWIRDERLRMATLMENQNSEFWLAGLEKCRARLSKKTAWEAYEESEQKLDAEIEDVQAGLTDHDAKSPAVSREEVSRLESVAAGAAAKLALQERRLNAWTEMALQARDKPECCNECLKCGLEVKWPSDMSSDEFLILMADEIAETKALMADVGTKATTWKEVWRTFDAVRNRLQARLDDANRRLSLLKDKPPEKSALTDEEAEKERSEEARITNLLAILPEHNRQMQQVNNQLTDRKRNLAAMVMGGINEEIISSRERGATTEALTALFEKIGKQETSLVAMDKHIGQLSVLAGQWTQLNTRMGKTVDEHNKTVSLLEQPLPDVSAPEGVTDVLGWWEQSLALKQQEREQAVGREQQANSNYTSVNNRFFDFQRRMEADKEKDKLLGDLRRLKDLLTVEGLPRAYVTYQFEAIARLTQESLVRLDADFAISIDPDRELAFSFVRLDEPGGYVMQAEKLSGGQKVKLAVAFLMAVQQRLVSQVGVLVLDEPSVHLDEASVGALVEFVRGLGQELKNADSQVWIVDHAKEMTAALEKCLVLGSPEKG